MQIFVCFALLVTLVNGFDPIDSVWENYKIANGKRYSADEDLKRKNTFKDNIKFVAEHNKNADRGLSDFKLTINKFSDQDKKELKGLFPGLLSNRRPSNRVRFQDPRLRVQNSRLRRQDSRHRVQTPVLQTPASRTWQSHMGPVKDQQISQCGSCFAFAVTGAIEGHYSIKNKGRVVLSEQNLVDCTTDYGNAGCAGGYPILTLLYIMDNGGISSQSCYPYEANNGTCRYQASCKAAEIQSIVDLPSGDEDALLNAVGNIGPVIVGMDAMQPDFLGYATGIYSNPSCNTTDMNHVLVVVGYGTEDDKPYWLLKNSWGSNWGINGYFKMKRGNNQCGIASDPSYPVLFD